MPVYAAELAWKLEGLCAQVDPELWFPDKGESSRAPKRICADCPVQVECLNYALENREPYGVWGGLSERQRRPLLPSEDVVAPAPAEQLRPRRETAAPVKCDCGLSYCSGKVCRQTRSVHLRKAAELARAQVAA